jgi:hypothetical protein
MITPNELREKANKLYYKVVSSVLEGTAIFPLTIPSNKQITGSNFSEWSADIVPLYNQSKAEKGKGYTVLWKEKKIQGTKQQVPIKIYFEALPDFLSFTNNTETFEKIIEVQRIVLASFPELKSWINSNPAILLDNYSNWEGIIKVGKYFVDNQPPYPFYLRELPIEVHSKFIEDNIGVIRKVLDRILPDSSIQKSETDFSARYCLKKTNVFTQIRILDDTLKPILGYDECALSVEDAGWLQWLPKKVFIIENKACFLSFPKVDGAVAIFGEGFKSRLSKSLPWLEKTKLYCWFDLDAAGFEMLNLIRTHHCHAISFLMDGDTFHQFKSFSVENIYRQKHLPLLSPAESNLYNYLVQHKRRLEQERISQRYIMEKLVSL